LLKTANITNFNHNFVLGIADSLIIFSTSSKLIGFSGKDLAYVKLFESKGFFSPATDCSKS
jgi:hypothetical protein